MLSGAQMNISWEHFAVAGGNNLYWSRGASRAMSRKINLLQEEERGAGYPIEIGDAIIYDGFASEGLAWGWRRFYTLI